MPVNIAHRRANYKHPKNAPVPDNGAKVWNRVTNDKHHIKNKQQAKNIKYMQWCSWGFPVKNKKHDDHLVKE